VSGAEPQAGQVVRICSRADVSAGEARRFKVGGLDVAVVRLPGAGPGEEDSWYVLDDTCSHADVSLSEGDVLVSEREIECWKHGSTFSLVSGEPQCLPAVKPVAVYDVMIDGDDVKVVLGDG
jgi:3-phenylpropionate/trans-cinnamate dioxygenase ferredoxin subunit